MCSRFENKASAKTVKRRFRLKSLPDGADAILSAPDRRPTDPILAIGSGPEAIILRFGLSTSWDAQPLLNARIETLTEKPTFRPLLETRCLIPATGYFEWRRQGKMRIKNRIEPQNHAPFAFAGLVDKSQNAAVILTCAPADPIAHVHGRMPVILKEGDEEAWLDPARAFASLTGMLRPFADVTAVEETPPPPRQPDLFI